MRKLLPIVLLLLLPLTASATLIEATNLYSGWTNAGVVGGIPVSSNMTIYTTITSTGDATDRTATINNALSACPSNQVVQLGAGTFRCASSLVMQNLNGVVLRGVMQSGTNATILDCRNTSFAMRVGNGNADWPWDNTGTALSANAPQGTNVLSFASTTAIAAGDRLRIYQDDYQSGNMVVMAVDGLSSAQTFQVKVLSKTSTTITLEDPIPFALTTARNAGVHVIADGYATRCGVEQVKFDNSAVTGTYGLMLWSTINCWVKDVEVFDTYNYNVFFMNAIHCTMKRSKLNQIQNAGNNGAGMLMERSSLNLIEDNYLFYAFPLIEWNFGCSGNVFAYNVLEDSVSNISIDSNHGAHNSFNLFEGNLTPDINPDGYFGSVSHETFFRNRVTGIQGSTRSAAMGTESVTVELKRFTRFYQIVGNVLGSTNGSGVYELTASDATPPAIYMLGYPNIGNRTYSGTAEPSTGDNWASWGSFPGPTGFQERDLDVANTINRKGNYNYVNNAIPAGEALGGDSLPDSYYLSAKPSWFGGLTWPPVDPTAPQAYWSNYYTAIPAGFRLLTGSEVPASGAPTCTITSPTSSATYSTSTATIDLSGTASDETSVSSVAWANDRGGSGSCTGTTSWSKSGITLYSGVNVITVTATDGASNTGTDTITVTYTTSSSGPGVITSLRVTGTTIFR